MGTLKVPLLLTGVVKGSSESPLIINGGWVDRICPILSWGLAGGKLRTSLGLIRCNICRRPVSGIL